MALSLGGITRGGGKNSLREAVNSLGDALSGYFVRYRLALYLLSAAAVALGVALNWNWLKAAGLLPIVAFLPCMLMMFMCMRHGRKSPSLSRRDADRQPFG